MFAEALDEYADCPAYWYVPKARTLNDANVGFCARTLRLLFDGFLGEKWNRETQDVLLSRLSEEGLLRPQMSGATIGDRTALVRIVNQLLGTLGFLWAERDQEIVITDAGFAMIEALANDADPRPIAESQVAKLQYPHPLLPPASHDGFGGVLPHLFLLQVLQQTGGYLTFDEHEVFVNLAGAQEDADRIVRYIEHWRRLGGEEQAEFLGIARTMPTRSVREPGGRYRRIQHSAPYQRAFFCYPSYLEADADGRTIRILPGAEISGLVRPDVKIADFVSREDWFAYYGDPGQEPSWFAYLARAVQSAETPEAAEEEVARNRDRLSGAEAAEIGRLEIEKAIETAYASQRSFCTRSRTDCGSSAGRSRRPSAGSTCCAAGRTASTWSWRSRRRARRTPRSGRSCVTSAGSTATTGTDATTCAASSSRAGSRTGPGTRGSGC